MKMQDIVASWSLVTSLVRRSWIIPSLMMDPSYHQSTIDAGKRTQRLLWHDEEGEAEGNMRARGGGRDRGEGEEGVQGVGEPLVGGVITRKAMEEEARREKLLEESREGLLIKLHRINHGAYARCIAHNQKFVKYNGVT